MHDLLVELRQLLLVKPRRRPAKAGKVEAGDQRRGIGNRLDRIAGPYPRQQGNNRLRLDMLLAETADAQRAQPLRQLALGSDQQRLVRECRRLGAQSLEHLNLHRGIGDMILAAHHMGDAHVDIVDRGGQHVEPAAILAPDHRIGQERRIKMLLAPDPVGPGDRLCVIQLEAPVRPATLFLESGPLGFAQVQRRPVIDRRLAAAELNLALQVQFLRGFIGRIDPARCLELFQLRFIAIEPRRLALLLVRCQPQPSQVGPDRLDIFLFRPLRIGIVEPQQKCPALLLREHPVVQRGADIADMKMARGRRGEAGLDGHTVLNALVIG